ncbi:MAG TPA: radical SAM family heme chaperone HemW [Chlamydiales bacterium]|nr:radical SAM family heme chaperone HemW [Chlamydiales bacterium]
MVTSLYFHIPFCTKKCPYCHFYVIPNRLPYHKILSESLALEWERQLPLLSGKTVTSIYFGGGTPTLFSGIGPLLATIPRAPDCEITIEANPEEISLPLLSNLKSLGINRLSLGVQSLDDRSLQTLERIHTAEKARQAIFDAQKAGFDNVSIDLMYDLPDQTEESWRYTLDQLRDLPIHHLSLYNLTIEPHTAFHKRRVQTPVGELSLRLLTTALEKLEAINLQRYEISAFAHPGHESRHNLGYWTARPFLGFGPSAFSYWEGERIRNIANLNRYARELQEGKSPVDFREKLPYPANVKELLAVRIRLREGVDLAQFALPPETQVAIEKLKEQGLVDQEHNRLKLTERGMLFYDTVATEII